MVVVIAIGHTLAMTILLLHLLTNATTAVESLSIITTTNTATTIAVVVTAVRATIKRVVVAAALVDVIIPTIVADQHLPAVAIIVEDTRTGMIHQALHSDTEGAVAVGIEHNQSLILL